MGSALFTYNMVTANIVLLLKLVRQYTQTPSLIDQRMFKADASTAH